MRLWCGDRGIIIGDPVMGCGLGGLALFWFSGTISPGAGTFGSFTWRFIKTDLLLFELGECRGRAAELLVVDDPGSQAVRAWLPRLLLNLSADASSAIDDWMGRAGFVEISLLLETSLWRPAFIVAAAWRDMDDRLGEVGGGESPAGFGFSCSAMVGDGDADAVGWLHSLIAAANRAKKSWHTGLCGRHG